MPGIESGKTWSRIGAESEPSQASASGIWQITEASEMIAAGKWQIPTDPVAIEKIAAATVTHGAADIIFSTIPQTYDDLWVTLGAEVYRWPTGNGFWMSAVEVWVNDDNSGGTNGYGWSEMYGDPNPATAPFASRSSNSNQIYNIGYSTDYYQSYDHTIHPIEFAVFGYTEANTYKNMYYRSSAMGAPSSWVGGRQGWAGKNDNTGTAVTKITFRNDSQYWDGETKVTLWGITRAGK
tara:strand:- start:853 stop:1563 length:711 start_codon:yes stop_codon:yes gene_type:complete